MDNLPSFIFYGLNSQIKKPTDEQMAIGHRIYQNLKEEAEKYNKDISWLEFNKFDDSTPYGVKTIKIYDTKKNNTQS